MESKPGIHVFGWGRREETDMPHRRGPHASGTNAQSVTVPAQVAHLVVRGTECEAEPRHKRSEVDTTGPPVSEMRKGWRGSDDGPCACILVGRAGKEEWR